MPKIFDADGKVRLPWIDTSHLRAKGDMVTGQDADRYAIVQVGTDGQTILADSTQTAGIRWADAATGAPPLEIVAGSTYSIAANTQVLHAIEFLNNGTIVNNGELVYLRGA